VVMGAGCYVGESARIERAVLWPGVSLGAGATLKQCIVGSNTTIEDNAHIINRVVTSDRVS